MGTSKETQKYNEKRAVKVTDRMEGQVLLRCSYLGSHLRQWHCVSFER